MTVKKRGSRFVLVSGTGKTLGTHATRAGAERQEKAITLSKLRKQGKIPKKRGG
tara:strand:- start:683 stop:844 length:162 start_codon:yes stop_codon:yes gene_type:complete